MTLKQPPRLGIDLGGTKIEAIVMQGDGTISHRQRTPTPSGDYEATLEAVADLTRQISEQAGLPQATPIGIGTPGAVSLKSGLMMNCNSTCLNHKPLAADLARYCGRKVRIANDADCFALSEASDGSGKNQNLVVGIILGTGVGGGIVFNQRLSHGVNAIRGEWGHNTLPIHILEDKIPTAIRSSSHACFCGRKDCIETWIAGPAFERHYEIITGTRLPAAEIVSLYANNDTEATDFFECHLHLTALAISSLINTLDPDAIVIGGGLSNIDIYYERLPEILPSYVFSDVLNTAIVKAEHGDSSGVRGAAWLWQPEEVSALVDTH